MNDKTKRSTRLRSRCEFVANLSDERLAWLVMHPPLGDDILDHALTCESCAKRVVLSTKAPATQRDAKSIPAIASQAGH